MHAGQHRFDLREALVRIIKYLIEGAVVGVAAAMIPDRSMSAEEALTIALVAAATFSLMDMAAPSIAASARFGAGAGLGANLVGFPGARPV